MHGMVIADSEQEALEKFKEATAFDQAPPELKFEINEIELIDENIPTDIDISDYIGNKDKKTLN